MTLDDNKAVYRRFIDEAFNRGNVDKLDELLTSDYVLHDAAPGLAAGIAGVRDTILMFRAAFPDLRIAIEEQIAEGDKVASRTIMTGTHRGVFMGIAPMGKAVQVAGLTMVTIRDGKVAESWVKNDQMSLMNQLKS